MNLERVSREVIKQNQEIELFNHDTILEVAQMVLCEALELVSAVENGFLTDDLTSIAGEAGDCLYLLLRLFNCLEIDERAVEMKIERNYLKYSNFTSKEEAIKKWKENGGDEKFYENYLLQVKDDE